MIEAIWDAGFKRSYKKMIRKNPLIKKRFWERLDLFLGNPFSPQLRTHKLSGRLAELWAFSVDDDCRVIFQFIGENRVLLIGIGSHDEVY